jgi:hypothetical protein
MYAKHTYTKTGLKVNQSLEGETIEQKVERVTTNKEPIKDGAPLIYTERSEGVQAGYNIRTDRFEVAVEAMDAVHKSNIAKRAQMRVIKDDKVETTHGTNSTGTNE